MVRPIESIRDVTVALPAGFVGNPQATRHCAQDFLTNPLNGGQCPPDTQVGTVDVDGSLQDFHVPLWTMETPKGVPALLAFTINGQPVYGYPEVRPYRLRAHVPLQEHQPGVRRPARRRSRCGACRTTCRTRLPCGSPSLHRGGRS